MRLYTKHIILPGTFNSISVIFFIYTYNIIIEASALFAFFEGIRTSKSCLLLQKIILHHKKFISNNKNTGFLFIKTTLICYRLVKTYPLWIIYLTFLSNAKHCRKKNSILCSLCILYIEKCYIVCLYISLSSLKTLVRLPCFFLKHLIHFFLYL